MPDEVRLSDRVFFVCDLVRWTRHGLCGRCLVGRVGPMRRVRPVAPARARAPSCETKGRAITT
eukprot:535725-Prymnesium_polylepis.1